MKYKYIALLVVVLSTYDSASCMAASADKQETIEEGKVFAESQNQNVINTATNVEDQDVPGFENNSDDSQRELYRRGSDALTQEAENARLTNDTAIYFQHANESRPNIGPDPDNDPLYQRLDETKDIAQSLTLDYGGCVDIPIGDLAGESVTEEQCTETGTLTTDISQCSRTWTPFCSATSGGPEEFHLSINVGERDSNRRLRVRGSLLSGTYSIVDPDGTSSIVQMPSFPSELSSSCQSGATVEISSSWEEWNSLPYVGGQELAIQTTRVEQLPSCENNFSFDVSVIDRGSFRVCFDGMGEPDDCIDLLLRRRALGATFNFNFSINQCLVDYDVDYQCDAGAPFLSEDMISDVCVDSEDKIVDGFNVSRECWHQVETYQTTSFSVEEEEYCSTLRERGCTYNRDECVLFASSGECLTNTKYFQCTNPAERFVEVCGTQVSCPDGECSGEYLVYEETTEDFQEAATNLEMVKEIAQNFDEDSMTVFTGEDMKCQRKSFGLSNCCDDSGWGVDSGLLSCDEEEETLGFARQDAKTHYVGRYTSGGFLDRRRYYVFCVYNSKLARIVIEQGNTQLGKEYGTPRNPICEGFTVEELQRLDFGSMDLSEFYDDAMENANSTERPSLQDILNTLNGGI
jgi:conjugal transfer mating pair stabilization protein TraN